MGKRLYALLALAFSAQAFAGSNGDYQLVLFENDSFYNYSYEKFESTLGADARLLDYYRCDGVREFAEFFPARIENPNQDSLRLQNDSASETFFYRAGSYYHLDGRRVSFLPGDFNQRVKTAISKLETLPSGSTLLRLLEKGRWPVLIRYGKWMSFNPTRDGGRYDNQGLAEEIMFVNAKRFSEQFGPMDQLGVGGEVNWDPESSASRMEEDGTKRKAANFVTLAHEMYHAYDANRGLLDRRGLFGANYEDTEVCEYRAMYFENHLRKEAGISYALHYGDAEKGAPGLLDSKGEPIFVPSPCLDF